MNTVAKSAENLKNALFSLLKFTKVYSLFLPPKAYQKAIGISIKLEKSLFAALFSDFYRKNAKNRRFF